MSARSEANPIYGKGMAIRASSLNSLRADIIDHEAEIAGGLHGDRTRIIAPTGGSFTNCSFNETGGYGLSSAGPWLWAQGLPVESGDRIKSLAIDRFGSGSGSINLSLRTVTAAGVRTIVQTATVSNPAASWLELLLTLSTPIVVAPGTQLYALVDGTTTAHRFNLLEVTYDRPAS